MSKTAPHLDFARFLVEDYPAEHSHPANVALHMFGTLAGLGLIGLALTVWPLWTALAWPVVHVAPGLAGHRLFERNPEVGDARLTRTDIPLHWFVAANHLLTLRRLAAPLLSLTRR
ncbi:MAG: Mpo1-like protein [Novosphingobium sp.]